MMQNIPGINIYQNKINITKKTSPFSNSLHKSKEKKQGCFGSLLLFVKYEEHIDPCLKDCDR
jgi:hypothetical protein